MLESLYIRNLAVVAELEIGFGPGLNTVTGETGAGKSLILGALQLLLGERASPSVIRQGENQCEISANFQLASAPAGLKRDLAAFYEAHGVAADEEGGLLLRRVITPSGTRNYINSSPVTLQLLKELGDLLIDIHGPHDHQSLLQPRCQLELLDAAAGNAKKLDACAAAFAALAEKRAALAALRAEHLSPQEEEFCRFQLAEIEKAKPEPGEDAELGARHTVVAHRRTLLQACQVARQGLTEAGDGAAVEILRAALQQLREVAEIDPDNGGPFREQLEQLIERVEELSSDVERYADSLDLDEAELTRIEERIGTLQKLRRKYGPALEDVLKTADTLRGKLDAVAQRQDRLVAQEAECAKLAAAHLAACKELRSAREPASGKLAKAITGKLQKLGFVQGLFEVRLAETEADLRGADSAEFCFAPNPGEKLLPLRQIASSGEMARVMLAVKTILSHADQVPMLVFDEVDANIGGRIAVMVADEMRAIAGTHQVMCITHLPQIAAAGDRHYRVSKGYADGRTWTRMDLLDQPGREEEITRMLGAAGDSQAALAHAREMLAHSGE